MEPLQGKDLVRLWVMRAIAILVGVPAIILATAAAWGAGWAAAQLVMMVWEATLRMVGF